MNAKTNRFATASRAWVAIAASMAVLAILLVADRWLIGPLVQISGPAIVHDGDTLSIAGERFRLDGIDAPEYDQKCRKSNTGKEWACGREAARQLRALIGKDDVKCVKAAKDRFGRGVATCETAKGMNINAWMVSHGWAIASGFASPYDDEQYAAKAESRGIWSGTFDNPADWRAQKAASVK
jgi:endonuclease YncB( thermonuclease family)